MDRQPRRVLGLATALIVAGVSFVAPALAQNQVSTVAGDFAMDPPTLVSLGFEWRISGDDNRNARVDVTFRKKGEQRWRQRLPLLRLQNESVPGGTPRDGAGHYFSYVSTDMFGG